MSFLDSHALHLPVMTMVTQSVDELEALSMSASHCCPNCDGELTIGEHQACGICTDCYFNGIRQ